MELACPCRGAESRHTAKQVNTALSGSAITQITQWWQGGSPRLGDREGDLELRPESGERTREGYQDRGTAGAEALRSQGPLVFKEPLQAERGCCGWSPKQGAALEGAAHSWALPAGGAVCSPGTQRASNCLIGNLNCDFLLGKKRKTLLSPNIPEALALCLPWGFSGMVALEMGVGGCHLPPV